MSQTTTDGPATSTTPATAMVERNTAPAGGRGRFEDIAMLAARAALGLMFLLAGANKIRGGVSGFVENAVVPNAPLPELLARAYGYALPFTEVIVGATLILGLLTRVSAAVIALMLLSFMLAMGILPESGPPFDKNVILFTLALWLVAAGGGGLSLDALIGAKRRPAAPSPAG